MRFMRIVKIFLFAALSAQAGVDSSGGGDPEAYIFVARLKEAASLLEQFPSAKNVADPQVLLQAAKDIHDSLNDQDPKNDLVEFVPGPLIVGGVHKPAMYDGVEKKIKIHRDAWLEYEQKGLVDRQRAIAVMEALLLKGIVNQRYEQSGQLIFIDTENIAGISKLVVDRRMVVSYEDCDESTSWAFPSGKTAETHTVTSSLNVNWKINGKEYTLRNYFPRLDAKDLDPLAAQTVSYFENGPQGKNFFVNDKRAILLTRRGELNELADKSRLDADAPEKGAQEESTGETHTRKVEIGRSADGGIIRVLKLADRTEADGLKMHSHISTCTYRFPGKDWDQITENKSFLQKIRKFQRQFDRVNAAEFARDICLSTASGACSTETEHLNRLDRPTMEIWRSLIAKADFSAEQKTVLEIQGKPQTRIQTPLKKHRFTIDAKTEKALDRAMVLNRLQSGDFSDVEGTLDLIYEHRYRSSISQPLGITGELGR